MSMNLNKSKVDSLRDQLHEVGLRATAARIAVLALLETATAPMSHAEVAGKIRLRGFDRATIYRNLVELADVGLVTRTDLGDHTWRYELIRESETSPDQPYFVCTQCNSVTLLADWKVTVTPLRGARKKLPGTIQQVLLKGTCAGCTKKA